MAALETVGRRTLERSRARHLKNADTCMGEAASCGDPRRAMVLRNVAKWNNERAASCQRALMKREHRQAA